MPELAESFIPFEQSTARDFATCLPFPSLARHRVETEAYGLLHMMLHLAQKYPKQGC